MHKQTGTHTIATGKQSLTLTPEKPIELDDFLVELDHEGIAYLWFSRRQGANVLGRSTLDQLRMILATLKSTTAVKGVIVGSKKDDHFVFGADLHEILHFADETAALKLASDGQQVFNDLADLGVPTLSMIHGPCLGGGLEAALATSYRLASDAPETLLGFPEVKLGLIPGLGGTQRLPRLINLRSALDLILTSSTIGATEALNLGIIDAVTSRDELLEKAKSKLKEMIGGEAPPRVAPQEKPETIKKLFATMERSFRIRFKNHYPAPFKALESVRKALESDLQEGLDFEAHAFAGLAAGTTSRNLIQIFFSQDFITRSAERSASKFCPKPPQKLGVIGTGVMATEIVRVWLQNIPESEISAKASNDERAAEFRQHFSDYENVKVSSEMSILKDCQMVIEAIVEDVEKKQKVLAELEAHVSKECVIATNTSSLELLNLGQELTKTDRFVGTHFFYPVDKMQLVEVVSHPNTTPRTSACAMSLLSAMKKTPLSVKDSPGFLVNRLLTVYLMEMGRLWQNGFTLHQLEDAAVRFGFPMGPFTLIDELGLNLCFSVAHELSRNFGERFKAPQSMFKVWEVGHAGKVDGKGFFLWDKSGKKLGPCPDVLFEHDIKNEAVKLSQSELDELQRSFLMPMLDEAARCLEEKVVRKPREIDLSMVIGTGFPAFTGGPLRFADHLGIPEVLKSIETVYARTAFNLERRPCELLYSMNESGRRFYSSGNA